MDKMQKIKQEDMHQSMRGYFAGYLYNAMIDNEKIWLVTADLGYGVFDKIQRDFPERFLNTGAAEMAACGICVGLALEGCIPVFYSITTFGLYRPFECIRNYINHEQIPVKLAMSGRDKDYSHDGFSHWSEDAKTLFSEDIHDKNAGNYIKLGMFKNIESYWPEKKEEIPDLVSEMIETPKPYFLSLRR